jgi:hypothetical protein
MEMRMSVMCFLCGMDSMKKTRYGPSPFVSHGIGKKCEPFWCVDYAKISGLKIRVSTLPFL